MTLHYRMNRKGEWYWLLVGRNNEPLSKSSEYYKNLHDAEHCWHLTRRGHIVAEVKHGTRKRDILSRPDVAMPRRLRKKVSSRPQEGMQGA